MGAKKNGPMLMHSADSSSGSGHQKTEVEGSPDHARQQWQGGNGHDDACG